MPAPTPLRDGHELTIWYRVTTADGALAAEADWMRLNGLPPWNSHDRR